MKLIAIVLCTLVVLAGWLWIPDSPSLAQADPSVGQDEDEIEASQDGETAQSAPETETNDEETAVAGSDEEGSRGSLGVFVPSERLPAGSAVSFPVDI